MGFVFWVMLWFAGLTSAAGLLRLERGTQEGFIPPLMVLLLVFAGAGSVLAQWRMRRGCLAGLAQLVLIPAVGLAGGMLVASNVTHDRESVVTFLLGSLIGLELIGGAVPVSVLLLNLLGYWGCCALAVHLDSQSTTSLLALSALGLGLVAPSLVWALLRQRRGEKAELDAADLNRGLLWMVGGTALFALSVVIGSELGPPVGVAFLVVAIGLVVRHFRRTS